MTGDLHHIALPAEDAEPSIVRQFIADVLHSIYHVSKEKATDIASNWKHGSGSGLTLFDVETFREMFGPEAGALVYHYVASDVKSPAGSTAAANGQ